MAALVIPVLGVPVYCGAFVGMTSARLFSAYGDLCLAAAIAGGVYLLTRRSFQGYGGKLGTIDCDMVETTPVVFGGKLYRFEPGETPQATARIGARPRIGGLHHLYQWRTAA